jgi:hypothetical protein
MEITTNQIDQVDAELAEFDKLPIREKLLSAFGDMMAMSVDVTTLPLKESFIDGMYIREMFIPKGYFLAGRLHKLDCVNVCSQGSMDIITEDGFFNVTAPFTGVSGPSVLKLGYALEDTVWVNVFRTDETDLAKMDSLIAFTNAEMAEMLDPERKYLNGKEFLCL